MGYVLDFNGVPIQVDSPDLGKTILAQPVNGEKLTDIEVRDLRRALEITHILADEVTITT